MAFIVEKVNLSARVREHLEQIARGQKAELRLVIRARIVLYAAGGPRRLDANGRPIEIGAQRHQAGVRQTKANAKRRQRKKETVLKVQQLRDQGRNYSQIARELGISHSTAKKYAQMEAETLDAPARKAPRKNRKGEECFPIIYKMMAAGHNDVTILSYLRACGYDYALGTLHNRIAAIS